MAGNRFFTKCYIYLHRSVCRRFLSTEPAVLPELDVAVKEDIENNKIKPRKHPGTIKCGTCSLPENIVNAIQIVSDEHPVKSIVNDAKLLSNYLFSRHYPWEEEDLKERKANFTDNVKERLGQLPDDCSEEQARNYNNLVHTCVTRLMLKYNYKWSPLDLHDYSCMVYLFTRAAPNYAAVMRVFAEIVKRCPDYQPTSLFDFGSGVGSVSWAARSCWGSSLKEVVNVDSSSSMLDLAELLVKGGNPDADMPLGVYYRQFLPSQHKKHSLVVSAHSLMELPSRDSRLNTVLNLWNKTNHFLIIIEQGSKPGFKVVVEARDFILSLANDGTPAHVLAPCPHDMPCPRFMRGPYPCHFQVSYFDLSIGAKEKIKKELLSYVIIRKGRRKGGDDWPRVVRPVLSRHNHVICRLCTTQGDLREIIFTKKRHDKSLYKCAKVTSWGDRLPIQLPATTQTNSDDQSQESSSVTT